ncbi:MAG TPA: hypothetical protein VGL00_11370 [Terracidiphilus sp.]|jgi:hypothetical protein
MGILKNFFLCLLFASSLPAFAGVIVYSPANGADVSPGFSLTAFANWCGDQSVTTLGYSLDGSSYTATVSNQNLQTAISTGSGWHTVHVKAWGQYGNVCVTDVSVNVAANTSLVPYNSTSIGAIENLGNWQAYHDGGTGGWSSGAMNTVSSPSLSGSARQFYTTYGNYGGERYHVAFDDDENAHNFVYDAWVYLDGSAANIGNLEMDLNQTMPNGQTVIFGFQCDGYSGTWDYNANWTGPDHASNTWMHSSARCNVRSWGRNQWHHIQISYSRTDYGVVTYHDVFVDGADQPINATAPSAYALGWAPVLLTNFQVDGLGGGGSINLYLDNLAIYRW